jgi:hypothetical protein
MGVETTLAPYGQNKGAFPSTDLHTSNKNMVYESYDDRGFIKSGMTSKQWRRGEPKGRTPGESVLKNNPTPSFTIIRRLINVPRAGEFERKNR